DEIVERYDFEAHRQAGTLIDDSVAPPPMTAEAVKQRIEAERVKASAEPDRFPDGYYTEPDGRMIAMLVRTPVSFGDEKQHKELLDRVQAAVDRVGPTRLDPTMTVHYTGDLITGAEEYAAVKNDLSHVGIFGVLMILGVVFLYYLRVRTLIAMAV